MESKEVRREEDVENDGELGRGIGMLAEAV